LRQKLPGNRTSHDEQKKKKKILGKVGPPIKNGMGLFLQKPAGEALVED